MCLTLSSAKWRISLPDKKSERINISETTKYSDSSLSAGDKSTLARREGAALKFPEEEHRIEMSYNNVGGNCSDPCDRRHHSQQGKNGSVYRLPPLVHSLRFWHVLYARTVPRKIGALCNYCLLHKVPQKENWEEVLFRIWAA